MSAAAAARGAGNGLILQARLRAAWNAVRTLRRHMYIHVFFGVLVTAGLLAGGILFFERIFGFLMRTEVFGPPLMDRLVGIVMLAFFSMLVFSNLIVTLSTSYISREVDFLMALPFPHEAVFRQKLAESIFYSSWAFAVLSLPFFVGFGLVRDVAWHFYPMAALLVVPFLVIPATIGGMVTMALTAFVPARKTRLLVGGLLVISLLLTAVMARFMGLDSMFRSANEGNFMQIMSFLEVGVSPELPSTWLVQGLLSIAPANLGPPDFGRYLYWFAMLCATALFLAQLSSWLAPSLYYRGWALSKDGSAAAQPRQSSWAPLAIMDRLIAFLPRHPRALLSKDLKTFWRDPSQWTQLVILGGLMVIYLANIAYARRYHSGVETVIRDWKTLLSLFNLGATCFILSILTTRFIYPMLSLEGRQFWAVGLAPMPRATVIWEKYFLCVGASLAFALTLLLASNAVLQIEAGMATISIITTIAMALGLSSLSVGIGAILPKFREDNPARLANGLGGTANALASLAYIALTIALLAVPARLWFNGDWDAHAWWRRARVPWLGGLVLMQAAIIVLPMWVGLRRWKRMEF